MGCSWLLRVRCAALIVVLVVSASLLSLCLPIKVGFAAAEQMASFYLGSRLILADVRILPPRPIGSEMIDSVSSFLFCIFATFGGAFLPYWGKGHMTPTDALFDLSFPPDPEGKFCRTILDYMFSHPGQSFVAYPSVYADYYDMQRWVATCREVFPELSEEEQRLLAPFRNFGSIPNEVLLPPFHGPLEQLKLRMQRRQEGTAPYSNDKTSLAKLEAMLRQSIRSANETLLAEPYWQAFVSYYQGFDLREPIRIPGTWEAVGSAIRGAEVATFDATELLPKDLFNITAKQLADGEGEAARRIVCWTTGNKPISLQDHGANIDEHLRLGKPLRASPNQYVNTKRLGRFFSRLPNFAQSLGIEEEALRLQSFLWMGPVQRPLHHIGTHSLHFDEETNVYLQLTGEQFMLVMHSNFTDVGFGGNRHPDMPQLEALFQDPYLKQVPFHIIHLKPGDGLTFPGRAYHAIIPFGVERISLNFFYIPGWRKMEYVASDWYSTEARASLERLALRQLWARTLSRMYDDTGRGVIYMGTKLEYI